MGELSGKHGLIVGVANKRSIAWSVAQAASKASPSSTSSSTKNVSRYVDTRAWRMSDVGADADVS